MKDNKINFLESKIIAEYQVSPGTFMSELHHKQIFQKDKFLELLDCCEKLVIHYQEQKTENYMQIAQYIIFLMQWVLVAFIYHLDPDDLSRIKNNDILLEEMPNIDSTFMNYCIDRIRSISINIII